MIILDALRLVYVGPPKTASTTMHHWLAAVGGVTWEPCGLAQHSADIPKHAKGYFTFTTRREPFARTISLWKHHPGKCTLEYFMDRVEGGLASEFYCWPQYRWVAGVRLDAIVEVEAIEEVIRLPPLAGLRLPPIPRLNAREHAKPDYYYTDDLRRRVQRQYEEDFRWRSGGQ